MFSGPGGIETCRALLQGLHKIGPPDRTQPGRGRRNEFNHNQPSLVHMYRDSALRLGVSPTKLTWCRAEDAQSRRAWFLVETGLKSLTRQAARGCPGHSSWNDDQCVSRRNGRSPCGRARLEPITKILHFRAAATGAVFGDTVAHGGDVCIVTTTPPLRLSRMLHFGAPDMAHEAGMGWKGQPVELDARVDLEMEL
jgi:hypothetical protein